MIARPSRLQRLLHFIILTSLISALCPPQFAQAQTPSPIWPTRWWSGWPEVHLYRK